MKITKNILQEISHNELSINKFLNTIDFLIWDDLYDEIILNDFDLFLLFIDIGKCINKRFSKRVYYKNKNTNEFINCKININGMCILWNEDNTRIYTYEYDENNNCIKSIYGDYIEEDVFDNKNRMIYHKKYNKNYIIEEHIFKYNNYDNLIEENIDGINKKYKYAYTS